MWSVCGLGDTGLRWREEVCCRREPAEREISCQDPRHASHNSTRSGGQTAAVSCEEARSVDRASPYRQSAQFGIERMLCLFVGMCPKVGYFGSMGLLDMQGKPRRCAYREIGADQCSRTSWPLGLAVSPTTHIH